MTRAKSQGAQKSESNLMVEDRVERPDRSAPNTQRAAGACWSAAPERAIAVSSSTRSGIVGRKALDAAFHGRTARGEDEGKGKNAAPRPAAVPMAAAIAAVRRGSRSACRQLSVAGGVTAGEEAAAAGVLAGPAAVGVVDVKGD